MIKRLFNPRITLDFLICHAFCDYPLLSNAPYPPRARVLCVGHEPHMSRVSAVLLDAEGRSDFSFQPGSVVSMTFRGHPQSGQGTLRFFLQPADVLLLATQ